MIISVKEQDKTEEKQIAKLIENFNKEAKKQNSKYNIELQYGFPHLTKRAFWVMTSIAPIQIVNLNNTFKFVNGLSKEIFAEIELILKNIKEKFEIELIEDD